MALIYWKNRGTIWFASCPICRRRFFASYLLCRFRSDFKPIEYPVSYGHSLGRYGTTIDALQRGLADQLIIYASSTLSETASVLVNYMSVNSARNYLGAAEDRYSQMDYSGSINSAYNADMQAAQAKTLSPSFLVTSGLLIGLGSGGAVDLVVGYFLWKRKRPASAFEKDGCKPKNPLSSTHAPPATKPLRGYSEYQRWYCQNCKRYV